MPNRLKTPSNARLTFFYGKKFHELSAMTTIRLFTAASIIQIAVATAHLVGHFTAPRPANKTEAELLSMMATYHKQLAGGSMTILNAYDGLNIIYGLFFFFAALINLSLKKADIGLIKRVSAVNAFAMASGLVVACIFFFWVPIFYFSLCMAIFLMVWLRSDTKLY